MGSKIGLLKTNIIKNKSTKLFFKTMSSKFFHKSKTPKLISDFTTTKSTKFSDNNLTNTVQSSKYNLLKNKKNLLFMGLEDFHKKFILNKNNTMKMSCMTNNRNNKVINLKKYPLSPSLASFSSESKSRIIPLIKSNSLNDKKKINERNKVSFFSLYDENEEYEESNNGNFENILDNNKRDNKFKTLTTFQDNKNKSKLFNLNDINPYKNNLFKTYNKYNSNKNINKKNIYLNSDFSISKEISENNDNIKIKNDIQKKKEDKIKLFYGRNNIKLMDKFAYNYHHSVRTETNQEFFYKTKINIYNNYRKYLNKNAYLKHEVKKNFEVDKELIQERNIKSFDQLFTIYKAVLDNYMQFLQKKKEEILDQNEFLKKDKFQIEGEIKKIKIDIMKGISKMKEGFAIKYFLICVKNHTLSEEKFSKEDLKELERDRLKLNENYHLNNKEKKQKRKSSRKGSIINIFLNNNQLRKIQEHSLTKRLNRNSERKLSTIIQNIDLNKNFEQKVTRDFSTVKINKKFQVLNTTEEFMEHLDFLSSKVYNLIIDYNNKYTRNVYLKLELANIIQKTSDKINHSNYLQEQINLYQNTLEDLKAKNKIILSKLNSLKDHQFQRDVKLLLVINNIHQLYFNIKRENPEIIDINKEMIISYGERFYMTIIESFLNQLLNKIDNIKKRIPKEYEIYKFKFERRKKKKAFYNFQRLLAEKIQIKVDKVLQKAEKIIYKPYKKTNDFKIHKKYKVIKKEVKKSNFELFMEYLNDDSY